MRVFLLPEIWQGLFDPFKQSEGLVQAILLQEVPCCCCHLQQAYGDLHTLRMQHTVL